MGLPAASTSVIAAIWKGSLPPRSKTRKPVISSNSSVADRLDVERKSILSTLLSFPDALPALAKTLSVPRLITLLSRTVSIVVTWEGMRVVLLIPCSNQISSLLPVTVALSTRLMLT